jgi:hypothetical protein
LSGSNTYYTAGNVGIGVTSPSTQLYVKGSGSGTFGAYNDPLIVEGTNYSYMHLKGVNNQAGILYNRDGSGGWFYGLDNSGNLKASYMATINEAGVTGAKDGTSTGFRVESGGNFLFNSGYGGIAPAYGCRAWVSFNGTGTPAIRGSGNVSSITDDGTGRFRVNFTNAMPDSNYSAVATARAPGTVTAFTNLFDNSGAYSTTQFALTFYSASDGYIDPSIFNAVVCR